ncbi:hypothetical protein FRC04_005260 [Tulasnella sp. 424]|nr:hypothetical protein FRC04_005260 [Tulasnella sp. 424]KAG8962785.1 hypothetical protein FRC05_005109 [Tulasnella sp. 425]
MADDPPSSDSIHIINVQHPTAPNVPTRREPGLSHRASPQLAGATLSPRASTTPPPEESTIQPGSQPCDLPDPLRGILTKIKRIGGGAYGNVYQGVWTLPGKDPIPVGAPGRRGRSSSEAGTLRERERLSSKSSPSRYLPMKMLRLDTPLNSA